MVLMWPQSLPILPTSIKKSKLHEEFEKADGLLGDIMEQAATSAQMYKEEYDKVNDNDNDKVNDNDEDKVNFDMDEDVDKLTWPTEEPTTMIGIVSMVILLCMHVLKYEKFCQKIYRWAERHEFEDVEAMEAMEDRVGSMDDVTILAYDVLWILKKERVVTDESVDVLWRMVGMFEARGGHQ